MNFHSKYSGLLFFFLTLFVSMEGFAMDSVVTKSSVDKTDKSKIYIKQSGKTYIKVKAHSLKVTSGLDINVDVVGDGQLQIGTNKKVDLNAHDCSIDNLVINEGSVVELKGDLVVNKQIVIQNAFLLLGDNDLILSEDAFATFVDSSRVIQNGAGQILSKTKAFPLLTMLPLHFLGIHHFTLLCVKPKTTNKLPVQVGIISTFYRDSYWQNPLLEREPHPPKKTS